ncbi:hypothetical protein LAD64_23610 [Klebsiella pneumoniae]|nr:hypothetical protein [Klebsiella pneumoniae]
MPASIRDTGAGVHGRLASGQQVLGMRLTGNKRFTLAPIATSCWGGFQNSLPGSFCWAEKRSWVITCALIPHLHPGVEIGRRHFP